MRRADRLAPEFQRPDFGEAHGQSHRQILLLQLLPIAQQRYQRRMPVHLTGIQLRQISVCVVPHRRTVKVERHWPVGQHREITDLEAALSPRRFQPATHKPHCPRCASQCSSSAHCPPSPANHRRAAPGRSRRLPTATALPIASLRGILDASRVLAKPMRDRLNDSLARHLRNAEASIEQEPHPAHHRVTGDLRRAPAPLRSLRPPLAAGKLRDVW